MLFRTVLRLFKVSLLVALFIVNLFNVCNCTCISFQICVCICVFVCLLLLIFVCVRSMYTFRLTQPVPIWRSDREDIGERISSWRQNSEITGSIYGICSENLNICILRKPYITTGVSLIRRNLCFILLPVQ